MYLFVGFSVWKVTRMERIFSYEILQRNDVKNFNLKLWVIHDCIEAWNYLRIKKYASNLEKIFGTPLVNAQNNNKIVRLFYRDTK